MINTLSWFDWISCVQVAIQKAGIKTNYFASEINKHSIQITQRNFPNTIQLWDVKNIKFKKYLNYINQNFIEIWRCEVDKIDLFVWWFPCQDLSFSWKMEWLKWNRSSLFFEFARLVKEIKPRFFIWENVKMKKEWQDIISEYLWVQPIEINSSSFTAQIRKRLYWVWELQEDWTYKQVTISNFTGPGEKLSDILEKNVDEKYYLSQEEIEKAILNCNWKTFKSWKSNWKVPLYRTDKALCLTHRNFWKFNRQTNRVKDEKWIRILTPVEEERLQGLPDNYTSGFLDYRRREMIWNWMTVDVIVHILSHLNLKND